MNTLEVLNILRGDQAVGQILLGVFPIDKLPPVLNKPSALVINLDTSDKPGSHWVCIYFDERSRCDYFDSYGLEPNNILRQYMTEYASEIKCNIKCVQQLLSTTCGQLCVYFLVWRSRGVPMRMIVKSLEQRYTDEFVTSFINKLFKVNTTVINETFIINQISKQWNNFM